MAAAVTGGLIEQRCGRPSGDDCIRHGVGVTLVGVTWLIDTTFEPYTAALLNDVRGLVRRCMQARRLAECHGVADRIGLGAELAGCILRGRAVMSFHSRDVVVAKAGLDL